MLPAYDAEQRGGTVVAEAALSPTLRPYFYCVSAKLFWRPADVGEQRVPQCCFATAKAYLREAGTQMQRCGLRGTSRGSVWVILLWCIAQNVERRYACAVRLLPGSDAQLFAAYTRWGGGCMCRGTCCSDLLRIFPSKCSGRRFSCLHRHRHDRLPA